jgi:hypothetical protein
MLSVLCNSPTLCSAVLSSSEISDKFKGVHRTLTIKESQVASYLRNLEGKKGSDVSAANATRTLFKIRMQIKHVAELLGKIGISAAVIPPSSSSLSSGPILATKVTGKNTIVRKVLSEISNIQSYHD